MSKFACNVSVNEKTIFDKIQNDYGILNLSTVNSKVRTFPKKFQKELEY